VDRANNGGGVADSDTTGEDEAGRAQIWLMDWEWAHRRAHERARAMGS
jgi:hypothetical protein